MDNAKVALSNDLVEKEIAWINLSSIHDWRLIIVVGLGTVQILRVSSGTVGSATSNHNNHNDNDKKGSSSDPSGKRNRA